MNLSYLADALDEKNVRGDTGRDINSIVFDSRKAAPGSLFVAIPGVKTDGHRFIKDALERGASAVMAEDEIPFENVPLIKVPDSRKALAAVASRFYDYPGKKLKIIGVTGTNGKTTTTHMIASIMESYGMKTGIIGTLYVRILNKTLPARVTTPESIEIQEYLSGMVDAGVDAAVMEVSSHALHFDRVAGLQFDGAVFTNLTQDHLDFHDDIESYFREKLKLFKRIKPEKDGGFAIINSDDPRSYEIIKILDAPYTTYGIHQNADVRAKNVRTNLQGTSFVARYQQGEIPVKMKLAGEFNVYNALASVSVGLSLGFPPDSISRGIANLSGVRGRFELIDGKQNFGVVVDYAHTPDGLKNLLESVRQLTKKKMIVVFGCGGDRDRAKRPIMGQIAAELADVVIITSDNPRTEEPTSIISEILTGVELRRKDYVVEADRKTAINLAVDAAEEDDLVVIAGKGHETYQIFRDRTIHFDDAEEARKAIKIKLQTAGALNS